MNFFNKFLLSVASITTIFSVGCSSSGDGGYSNELMKVYSGITIYNSAYTQNTIALDPASVAIKFAMLQDEAEDKQLSIEELVLKIESQEYKLKNLLLGVVAINPDSEIEGDYILDFDSSVQTIYENFPRRGKYRLSTAGLPLSQTSSEQPWVIKPEGDMKLTLVGQDMTQGITISGGETKIYAGGDTFISNCYTIQVDDLVSYFTSLPKYSSLWSGEFRFYAPHQSENLAFSKLEQGKFTLDGDASGTTLYTMNNVTAARMSYSAYSIVFYPSMANGSNVIVDGNETVILTNPEDYSVDTYPSPRVDVRRKMTDNKVATSVSYNGVTVQL